MKFFTKNPYRLLIVAAFTLAAIFSLHLSKTSTPQRSIAGMGGSSDGGGNAVMCTMFDLFENKDSIETTLIGLKQLVPDLNPLLDNLNKKIPAIENLYSGGLGDILVQHTEAKRLYLESKPMTSVGCINGSVFYDENRNVVGCQNDKEIRFNLKYITKSGGVNPLALVLHEMILAWFRSTLNEASKFNLEYEVRRLNEFLILTKPTSVELAFYLKSKLNCQAFFKSQFDLAKKINKSADKTIHFFCKNPEAEFDKDYSDAFKDLLIKNSLSQELISMIDAYEEPIKMFKEEKLKKLCSSFKLRTTPIHIPNPKLLSSQCIASLDESIRLVESIFKNFLNKGYNKDRFKLHLGFADASVDSSINLCSGLKSIEINKSLIKKVFMTEEMMNKQIENVYNESYNYFMFYKNKIYKKYNYQPELDY